MAEADFQPAFEAALRRGISGFDRITAMTRLSGGASQETWSFDAAVGGKPEGLILRRSPGGVPRVTEGSSAIGLATEAFAIEEARKFGVAAPRVRYVLKESDGVGQGYVMERLPGETIARKILRDKEFDAVRPRL